MPDLRPIREIADELIANYERQYPHHTPLRKDERLALIEALKVTQMPAPVVEAAIRMEQLTAQDRDWLERLRIKV